MNRECFECDINQMKKISKHMGLDIERENKILEIAENYLQNCDMSKTNPEIMCEIWKQISKVIQTDNPYKEVKSYYNQLLLTMEKDIESLISIADNPNRVALKIAIIGNLIDFAAKHKFNEKSLREMINNSYDTVLEIDDSEKMFEEVKNSKTLLYLGDNCGEIVIDKVFIKRLKQLNPKLNVYYGVRGKPIVNDVTIDDAKEVDMDKIANVISNGDGSLGTVLDKTNCEFKDIFKNCDMVISKGQGNYEGLLGNTRNNVYFLFMAKCNLVANPIGVKTMSIVCLKNNSKLKWGSI